LWSEYHSISLTMSLTLWIFLEKLVLVVVMKIGFYLLLSCLVSSRSLRLNRTLDLLLYSLNFYFLRYYWGLRLLTRAFLCYANIKLLKVFDFFCKGGLFSKESNSWKGKLKRWVTWNKIFFIYYSFCTLHSFLESLWLIFWIFPVCSLIILFCIFIFFS